MKIKKTIILLVFLLCYCLDPASAQQSNSKFLGVEAGITIVQNEMLKMEFLRGDVPSYYSTGKSASYANSSMSMYYAGIKYEYPFFNNKLGIMAGINYTSMSSSISKNKNESNSSNYFYFLYHQDGVNTEYLKINEINQKSDYLGIPIDLRYFLFKPRPFCLYIKLGAEFCYRLHTKTDVDFFDKAMETYKEGVIEKYDQPEAFSSLLNLAGGFRIGKDSKPAVNLEIRLFSVFLTSRPSSLADPIAGAGVRLEIQVPLKSKSK